MYEMSLPLELQDRVRVRAGELRRANERALWQNTDRLFGLLLVLQWAAGVVIAAWLSPRVSAGLGHKVHPYVWMAVFLGGAIAVLPIGLILSWPGAPVTRYVISGAQALHSALLIHLTGGRIEAHFHIFGSLAFLSCYRDWRVLVPATLVTALDPGLRGYFWPESAFGIASASFWRASQHVTWVLFEDIFLAWSCIRGTREMAALADGQARLEFANTQEKLNVGNAVDALQKSEAEYRAMFELASVGKCQVAPATGRFLRVNRKLCEITGYRSDELLTKTVFEITHAEDREISRRALESIFRDPTAEFSFVERYVQKTGRPVWVNVNATVIADAEARPARIDAIIEDITERREADEALHASERRLRQVVESDMIGVMFWNVSGFITDANAALLKMLGYTRGDLQTGQLRWDELTPPEYRQLDAQGREQILARGTCKAFEKEFISKDGTRLPVLIGATSFDAEGTNGVAWVVDLTERKHAQEIERERNSLRDAIKAQEQVLGVVGHELRTPLAGLRAMSEFLLEPESGGMQETEIFLRSMHQEVVRMSDTVNNLLEAALLNSGRGHWNWGPFRVVDVCNEALDTTRPLIDWSAVTLEARVEPEDVVVNGDAEAVRRLITNLLSNSHKHTAQGTIRVEAGLEEQEGQKWLLLRVCDTGSGVTPEIASRLGEAFALNAGVVGGHVGGTGLGLAICKGIVAAHGGEIGVDSTPGVGTTITVRMRADLPGPMSSGAGRLTFTSAQAASEELV
ncbi:MAG: hybrid sensor histidine kinase/response regulator [Phycisphaerales bacterium]|nr:hybrid sensor histidine kinase/response regulator [Phycisphaerales bacterium]